MNDHNIKRQIIARVNIDEYIGHHVQLQTRRRGESVGLCPFHSEKTPSFYVSADKGFFHCFGCRASGDVIKFVMMLDNISYGEAIDKLAKTIGVSNNSLSYNDTLRSTYFSITKLFTYLCQKSLHGYSGRYALAYIRERNISEDAISAYKLGYLPRYDMKKIFDEMTKNFSTSDIFAAGIFRLVNDTIYSQFNNRIIFPIIDSSVNILGFGARVVHHNTDSKRAKYINSSDSSFFHKSDVLYGIHLLHKYSNVHSMSHTTQGNSTNDTIFIVEGYMDVLALHSKGIKNAVGVLGANLTQNQLRKLWHYHNRPTLCLDNDTAGTSAMVRCANIALQLLEPGKSISLLMLENGKDPDEIMKHHGVEYWNALVVKNTKCLADFIFDKYSISASHDPEGQVMLRKNLNEVSDIIKHNTLRQEYKRYFNARYWSMVKGLNTASRNTIDRSMQELQVAVLQHTTSNLKQIDNNVEQNEQLIYKILSTNPNLLHDTNVFEHFSQLNFVNNEANAAKEPLIKHFQNTSSACGNTAQTSDEEIKKILNLIISLQLKHIRSDASKINVLITQGVLLEEQLMQLKRQEIDLKDKLDLINNN